MKKTADISDEEIDSYILNLIFDNLFKKLHELNYDKVKDIYWNRDDRDEEPDIDIFNFLEKRNVISVLADHLEKYIRKVKIHYTNRPVEILKEFIANNKQNFRMDLSIILNYCPLNFDYLLIKDVFIDSMECKNPNLTISINDIIFVYNNLVEKGEIIFILNHPEDPVYLLI